MEFKIDKNRLMRLTQIVQNISTTKTTLPILSNLLLETTRDKVKLSATDLDVSITINATGAQIQESGAITIPSKRLTDIIRELPEGDVEIAVKKNNAVTIKAANCFFKLMGLPKEEFPKIQDLKEKAHFSVAQDILKKMLMMTVFAASHDETRYVLNGTLFSVKNGTLWLVSTDGRRLAMVKRDNICPKGLEISAIVPTKATQELARVLQDEGDIKIAITENQIGFELSQDAGAQSVNIVSRLIEGEFPNYEQVIPQDAKEKISIDKDKLLAAVRRANLFTTQESQSVKFDILKNKMVVSKNTPDLGEAKEELELEANGGELSIGFNPNYIIDVLKTIEDEKILFELTDPEKPAVIKTGTDYLYVVLPMQIT